MDEATPRSAFRSGCAGFGAYEIAGQEKPTERRVRQIVAEAVEGREALESAVHAVGAPIRRENRASGHSRRLIP